MLARVLDIEEKHLRNKVVHMGEVTQGAISQAIRCYSTRDMQLAHNIINDDAVINELEHEIEAECINIIARQQPVAHDLREILTDMNIAKELERIADYAVAIAKRVQKLPTEQTFRDVDILEIAEQCSNMLAEVMIAYAEKDVKKARLCALKDDEIDEMEQQLNAKIFQDMKENSSRAIFGTYKLSITHYLERIGDRVTNIAEKIVFLSTGKVVNLE